MALVWDLLVSSQYRQGGPSRWPTCLLSGWVPSLLTLSSAAIGSWRQNEVSGDGSCVVWRGRGESGSASSLGFRLPFPHAVV